MAGSSGAGPLSIVDACRRPARPAQRARRHSTAAAAAAPSAPIRCLSRSLAQLHKWAPLLVQLTLIKIALDLQFQPVECSIKLPSPSSLLPALGRDLEFAPPPPPPTNNSANSKPHQITSRQAAGWLQDLGSPRVGGYPRRHPRQAGAIDNLSQPEWAQREQMATNLGKLALPACACIHPTASLVAGLSLSLSLSLMFIGRAQAEFNQKASPSQNGINLKGRSQRAPILGRVALRGHEYRFVLRICCKATQQTANKRRRPNSMECNLKARPSHRRLARQ